MEILLPSLLFVQYANFSRYCEYPFVGPLCTILESMVAIDLNLKVGIIFIEENFFEGGLTAIHCSSLFNGLSIDSYKSHA